MIARLTGICRSNARRIIAFVVAVSMLASVLPMPVWRGAPQDKDSTQPFPCQDRPCGCRSAEQCWKKCCCFTNAQKLAWAKSRGVRPPEFVVIAARQESGANGAGLRCAHCASRGEQAICSRATRETASNSARQVVSGDTATTVVIGVMAQECQGHGWGFHAMAWCNIPEPIATLPAAILIGPVYPPARPLQSCVTLEPPVPPPRLFSGRHFVLA